ncbi:helix-turn-helix domain-containing protein [Streptomyces sp. XM4011]|uniref:helix-turn-helix domain-containing protein n=1 Tax=Streptomyces sp. XM4011 TaxID=2929780 RepID=UPI001FF7E0B9|nr:helix-turn-helix transcriptional regulator [Streptomyces sp. XM4011]MCK1812778.1 helix-turn-helix domain-containing protein [Streptomyces sp. XM4011]
MLRTVETLARLVSEDTGTSADLPLRMAELAATVRQDADDLCSLSMRQARDRGVRTGILADHLGMSSDTVRAHSDPARLDRRMYIRLTPQAHDSPPDTTPPDNTPDGNPLDGPDAVLSRALSYLQRTSGRPIKDIAAHAGVSPSFISRVLSGERRPTWPIARSITRACGGDHTTIRPLWEATRGAITPSPHAFHAAVQGLHLSAAHPTPHTIHRRSRHLITMDDIYGLLHGAVPDNWWTVDRFVYVLRGQPHVIKPLWDAARDPGRAPRPPVPLPAVRLPAEAFG